MADLWENIYHEHIISVHPIGDSDIHDEESQFCKCEPKVITGGGKMIIVHNAFDGRHFEEQIQEILKGE